MIFHYFFYLVRPLGNRYRQKIVDMKKPKYPVGAALCGRLFGSPQRGSPTRHQGTCPEGATSSGRSPGRGVDSYTLKSENLSLTFFKKLPLTPSLSPLGRGEG